MKHTKSQPKTATPGFAIRLTDETDLGIAMLIAEDDAGEYLPVGPVSTIAEAREIAQYDMRNRMGGTGARGAPLCPAIYKVWARGLDGCMVVAVEFDASTL